MNRAAKIGLGCLFVPVGFVALMVIMFVGLNAAGVPDPQFKEDSVEQKLPSTMIVTERLVPASELTGAAIIVELDLEEGMFHIEPGPAEAGIQVEAEYDEATYTLTKEYDIEGDIPVFRLKFESKIGLLRRIAQDGGLDDQDLSQNRIDIFLPEDTPMALFVHTSKSESEFILDGLALTELVTKCSMGEYSIEIDEPNPLTMTRARFELGMGESTIRGLSNLRARTIDVRGSMGEIRVDFGTSLLTDTTMNARMRMGEMSLRVPDDALWNPDSKFKAVIGEVNNNLDTGMRVEDPEKAKHLNVSGSVMMGELTVDKFRSRADSTFRD